MAIKLINYINVFWAKKTSIILVVFQISLAGCVVNIKELESKAESEMAKGNYKNAKRKYTKLIKEDSNNPNYYVFRAECMYLSHAVKNKYSIKVINEYNKALAITPWYLPALKSRARFYYFLGSDTYSYSIRDIDKVFEVDLKYAEGYLLKFQIYMERRDTVSAYKSYNSAFLLLENDRDKRILLLNKGLSEFENGYFKNAIISLKELRVMNSTLFNSNDVLAQAYWKMGINDSACHYFQLSTRKIPNSTMRKIEAYCK